MFRRCAILGLVAAVVAVSVFTNTSPDQWSKGMASVMIFSVVLGMVLGDLFTPSP